MNKDNKHILKYIFLTFMILFSLLNLKASKVHAVAAGDFDDGIKNWTEQTTTTIGYRKINSNLSLGYTFDSWDGNDPRVVKDSTTKPYYQNSKINIFLHDLGQTTGSQNIQAFYDGNIGLTPNTLYGPVDSSLDFGIVYSPTQALATLGTTDSALLKGVTGKRYFVGTNADGNQASKVVGTYAKTDSNGQPHNFEVEILMRPSAQNSGSVQIELYIKNTMNQSQSYGILYGKDTDLNDNDGIPIQALANNSGLFMADGKYKLIANRNVKDGPTNYGGGGNFGGTHTPWLDPFTPQDFSGVGAEVKNYAAGTNIEYMPANGDSYYVMKWPFKTIAPGDTDHYQSDMGVSESPYAVPASTKSFTNETSTDGKNHVGDTLKFRVSAVNNGYNSSWNKITFKDPIPKELQVDTSTITMTDSAGNNSPVPASDLDITSNTLTVPSGFNLVDGQVAYINFKAKILPSASAKTLTNTSTQSGTDSGKGATGSMLSVKSSVDIPVAKAPYVATFSKGVKNLTAGDGAYAATTTGKYQDTLSYQLTYTVDATSQYTLSSGTIKDTLPTGLKLVPGSVAINGTAVSPAPTDLSAIKLPAVDAGQKVTVTFQATIDSDIPNTYKNTATILGVNSNGGVVSDATNEADVNPKDSLTFLNVPKMIDFGTHKNNETNILNQTTTGSLQVENYTSSKFYTVKVAYDNTNANRLLNGTNSLVPEDGTNLLFFNQLTSDGTTSSFTPITSTGTPISANGFNQLGKQDLTNNVGSGQFKLNATPQSQKVGKFSGTLTWILSNTP